jgi:hypothetical protein
MVMLVQCHHSQSITLHQQLHSLSAWAEYASLEMETEMGEVSFKISLFC